MAKTMLATGAGSGFGEAAAIGMARNGHAVIATVRVSPQVMPLRRKAEELGLANLRVERLDLADPYDIDQALTWDFDVPWNDAGQGESGPVWEIPADEGKFRNVMPKAIEDMLKAHQLAGKPRSERTPRSAGCDASPAPPPLPIPRKEITMTTVLLPAGPLRLLAAAAAVAATLCSDPLLRSP